MSLQSCLSHKVRLGNRYAGQGERIFLTGEIGSAHLGSMENARKLIKAAAESGCDGADIFMSHVDDFYYCSELPGVPDIKKEIRVLEFTFEEWQELFAYAETCGILLYPTPLDYPSLEWCRQLAVKMININSDDANNPLFLKRAASLGVPVTMHDIAMSIAEISMAVRTLQTNGCHDIILLHSTLESGDENMLYATVNLEVINTYKQLFGGSGVLTGCVEHTSSDFLIYAVAALHPVLISKHIQLSEENPHDTEISVNTEFLNTLVRKVRAVEDAMGNGENQLVLGSDGEVSGVARRKVLVANRDIPAGKVIEEEDLCAKRPGHLGGLAPMEYIHFVGAVAKAAIQKDTVFSFAMIEAAQPAPYKYPTLDTYIVGKEMKNARLV